MVQDKGNLAHSHPANELTEKLFGIESVIVKLKKADATGASLSINSVTVPTGKIWKITYITAFNADGDITNKVNILVIHDGTIINLYTKVGSTAQNVTVNVNTELYLDAGDSIIAYFDGVASPETCYLNIFGYEMNAP